MGLRHWLPIPRQLLAGSLRARMRRHVDISCALSPLPDARLLQRSFLSTEDVLIVRKLAVTQYVSENILNLAFM